MHKERTTPILYCMNSPKHEGRFSGLTSGGWGHGERFDGCSQRLLLLLKLVLFGQGCQHIQLAHLGAGRAVAEAAEDEGSGNETPPRQGEHGPRVGKGGTGEQLALFVVADVRQCGRE